VTQSVADITRDSLSEGQAGSCMNLAAFLLDSKSMASVRGLWCAIVEWSCRSRGIQRPRLCPGGGDKRSKFFEVTQWVADLTPDSFGEGQAGPCMDGMSTTSAWIWLLFAAQQVHGLCSGSMVRRCGMELPIAQESTFKIRPRRQQEIQIFSK
jgi:hypothetical protein